METEASPVDRRRWVVALRVGGFLSLLVALLGGLSCIAAAAMAIVDAGGDFQTVNVPARTALALGRRHYVIYYEDSLAVPEGAGLRGLGVSIRPGVGTAQDVLPISSYGGSFTYSLGGYHGRAEGTFDTPHAGVYVVTTSNPYAAAERARIVIGPSVLGLLDRYVLPGALAAIVVFFGAGGVGALLLTRADRVGSISARASEIPTGDRG